MQEDINQKLDAGRRSVVEAMALLERAKPTAKLTPACIQISQPLRCSLYTHLRSLAPAETKPKPGTPKAKPSAKRAAKSAPAQTPAAKRAKK